MALRTGGLVRCVSLGLLSSWLAVAAVGCAAAHEGIGSSGTGGSGLAPGVSEAELEEAAAAESSLHTAQVEAMAEGMQAPGAWLSFTFWNEHGALTLVGFSAQAAGATDTPAEDGEETRRTLATVFSRYPRSHTGMATLTLQREPGRWRVDYTAAAGPRPTEARTLPLLLQDFPADTVRASTEGLRPVLAALRVPAGGEARAEVEALLEDGRVEGFRLRLFQLTRGNGPPRALAAELTRQAVQALLPFTLGLGTRTLRLNLRLTHRERHAEAAGWVESIQVVRPPPQPETNAAFIAEYRAMHESILWRWRQEVKEGAEWVARRGVEELALWYAGGVLLKGGGYLAGWSGSVMRRALGRGGEAAAGWLRTALTRLPSNSKREFEWLWAKVELQGEHALTAEERTSLRGLMERIELLVKTKLEPQEKNNLRRAARESYKKLHPELAELLEEYGEQYPIHHKCPLEYAHLFASEDINAANNLAMVRREVHVSLNRAWNRFRQLRPDPTAAQVRDAARLIDDRFAAWYGRTEEALDTSRSVADAEQAALRTLDQFFPN